MPDTDRRHYDHWALDKRVPVALVLALLLQGGTGIWWVSALNSEVEELKHVVEKHEMSTSKNDAEIMITKDRVLKLEIISQNINENLAEIKEILKSRMGSKMRYDNKMV